MTYRFPASPALLKTNLETEASLTTVRAMKTLTVGEAEGKLGQLLAEAARGDLIVLTDGAIQVTLTPNRSPDSPGLEDDSPELEAALVQAIDGPFRPYSEAAFRMIGERILREQAKR